MNFPDLSSLLSAQFAICPRKLPFFYTTLYGASAPLINHFGLHGQFSDTEEWLMSPLLVIKYR